jgi:hypothetical protein
MTAPAAAAVASAEGDVSNPFPVELLAFSLTDGRSGVLSFRWVVVTLVDSKIVGAARGGGGGGVVFFCGWGLSAVSASGGT